MDDRHARHRRRPVDPRGRPSDGYRTLGPDRFERLVADALDSLPAGWQAYLDNVEVVVEDVPDVDADGGGGVLLGLYEGIPQTERAWGQAALPDRITVYRRPHELRARTKRELADLVRETVVHELAHHFGIDDDRLDDLGWG